MLLLVGISKSGDAESFAVSISHTVSTNCLFPSFSDRQWCRIPLFNSHYNCLAFNSLSYAEVESGKNGLLAVVNVSLDVSRALDPESDCSLSLFCGIALARG